MKVVFMIDSLGMGGAEKSTADLVLELHAAGVSTVVVQLDRYPHGYEDTLRARGLDLRWLRARSFPGRVRELRQVLREERPRVLHATHYRSRLLARVARIRLPVTLLESFSGQVYAPERLGGSRVRRAKIRIARFVDVLSARWIGDRFHAVGEGVAARVRGVYGLPGDGVFLVRRGRHLEDDDRLDAHGREALRRSLGVPASHRIICNVGRHEPVKGQVCLIEAMAEVARAYPAVTLLVMGREGTATPDLQHAIARLGLESVVRLLGYRADVVRVLQLADVFVLPSLSEGFSGAVLEAMGCGLPVVCSDLPELGEIVRAGETAEVVPPRDAPALARALCLLLGDEARRQRYGARARALFDERHTLSAAVEEMTALYEKIGA